ncbi:MAG TPA: tRNA pseudouridine(55) synthase TruB [Woeseiaceae bacterium]
MMIPTKKTRNDPLRPAPDQVDGVLLLDKPHGLTSNQALQKVKRLLNAKKAGHTGSLDPAATGMLPLCFGEATKICAYMLDADKKYRVTARLGESTDTGDADGQVMATADVPDLQSADWLRIFERFIGEIQQVPPMYSALKVDGKRLYALARQGQTVERKPRTIRIHELQLLEAQGRRLVFRAHCSKGTYIRTLVEDLAKSAGTIAHTVGLHRESVGDFQAAEMLDLPGAQRAAEEGPGGLKKYLLAPDQALLHWPERHLDGTSTRRFVEGQSIAVDADGSHVTGTLVRVYGESQAFVGIGELTGNDLLKPRRLFRTTR